MGHIKMKNFTLGRLREFDERSRNFPMRELLSRRAIETPKTKIWQCNKHLDQRSDPACVGFSWTHNLIARPVPIRKLTAPNALTVYKTAQTLDEWPGENYAGSSVLGGAKAVKQLYPNIVKEYRWIFSIDDLIATLGYHGPVVVGTNWYNMMFYPDKTGLIKVGGAMAGGHAYLLKGVRAKKKVFVIHNSWGKAWGKGGDALIKFEDFEALFEKRGEACTIVTKTRK